jgi:two-component system sensor kinase FixL
LQKEQYLSGIGQAASAIVHDLKNPVVTILGFAKRLQEGKGKQDLNVQAIIESAHGMERIVNDVLDFARPIRLELQEEDLRHVVSRACDVCRAKAEETGVSVSCVLPPRSCQGNN